MPFHRVARTAVPAALLVVLARLVAGGRRCRQPCPDQQPARQPGAVPASHARHDDLRCADLDRGQDDDPSALGPNSVPSGYGPADLQSAYALPNAASGAGTGMTVAVVDAYDLASAESDLGVYRSQFGLSACTTANGCFSKVDQDGGTNYPGTNAGWNGETALDIEMVSAICPNCKIILVEADDSSGNNLLTAEIEAVALGADVDHEQLGRRRVPG